MSESGGAERIAGPLLAFLRRRLDTQQLTYASPPRHLAIGAESTVFAFSLAGTRGVACGPLVCRLALREKGEILAKEAATQSALAELGFPAPRIVARGDAGDGLGSGFLVMERIPGRPLMTLLPGLYGGCVVLAAFFPLLALLALAALHLYPARVQRRLHGVPVEEFVARAERNGLTRERVDWRSCLSWIEDQVERSGSRELRRALRWLVENPRATRGREVVCHGDFWPGNVLVRARGLSGVVDWSAATVAEPEFDLAWSLVQDASELPFVWNRSPVWRRWLGRATHPFIWSFTRVHVAAYRLLGGPLDPAALRFYRAAHCLRMLAWARAEDGKGEENTWSSERSTAILLRRLERATGLRLALEPRDDAPIDPPRTSR